MTMDRSDIRSKISEGISPVKNRVIGGISRFDSFVESHEKKTRYLLLLLIAVFAAGLRLLPLRSDFSLLPETPTFSRLSGYESYRGVSYTVRNFPDILFVDTLPNYPVESISSMTGGFIDILLGSFALVLSQFYSTEQAVTLVLYLVGPVCALLMVLLVYKIGEEVFDSNTGLIASLILALTPGQLVQTTVVGSGSKLPIYAVIFGALVLSSIYYIRAARKKVFAFRFAVDDLTSWNALTKNLVAIVTLSIIYILSEPVHVLIYSAFLGLIGVQYGILSSEKDEVTESVASSLVIPLAISTVIITGVAVLFPAYTTVHVGTIALTTALVGAISKVEYMSEITGQATSLLASLTVIAGLVGIGIVMYRYGDIEFIKTVFQPTQESVYYEGIDSILVYDLNQLILTNFGLFGFISVLGYLIYHPNLLYDSLVDHMNLSGLALTSFAIVTAVMGITSIANFTITAMSISLFGSYFVFFIADKAELFELGSVDIRAYHILGAIAVLSLFIPILVAPVDMTAASTAQGQSISEPDWASASQELANMEDPPVDPYGNPMETPDSGVITWANYGSGPIQGIAGYPSTGLEDPSPQFSSEYLLSQNEEEAFEVKEEYGAQSEYIMLDWESVSMRNQMTYMVTKHPDYTTRDFFTPVYNPQNRRLAFTVKKEPYYMSLATRLYYYHGSRAEQSPVTVTYTQNELSGRSTSTTFLPVQMETSQHIRKFNRLAQAEQYVNGTLGDSGENGSNGQESDQQQADYDGTRQIGGVGLHPTTNVPALEHHRYVSSSSQSILNDTAFNRFAQITSQYSEGLRYSDLIRENGQVKIFQQVEGATIEGSGGPSDSRVRVVIALENEQTGTPVQYIQVVETDEDGNFEATVPYASEDLPENYTVQPTQNYQIIGQRNEVSQGEDGGLSISTTYWYAGEIQVTNQDVTEGGTIQVQLEEMSPQEASEEAEGEGIVQPQVRTSPSDSSDNSTDESQSEDGN